MAEHDWKDHARDPQVERMIHDTMAKARRRQYPGGNDGPYALVYDDLESYLWDKVADVLYRYQPPNRPVRDPDQYRRGYVWAALQTAVKQHWQVFVGQQEAATDAWHAGVVSIDKWTDDALGDTPSALTEGRYDAPGGHQRLHRTDPLHHLLHLELLERAVRRAEHQAHHGVGIYASETGQYCSEPMCLRPVETAGMCGMHYARQRDRWGGKNTPSCQEPDCDRPGIQAGLCRKHASYQRRTDPTRPRCSIERCDDAEYSRGLCSKHYAAERRAKKAAAS